MTTLGWTQAPALAVVTGDAHADSRSRAGTGSQAYADALMTGGPLSMIAGDGRRVELDVTRYLARVDSDDTTVLDRAVGPVLDVGCGPGRFVQALAEAGIPALGVDVTPAAVALSTDRGGPALTRDVFAPLPGEGRWPTVLLLDGNVGIGGDVPALLDRLAEVMAADGRLIVEVSASGSAAGTDEVLCVRFASGADAPVGPAFGWAVVDRPALLRHAAKAGLSEIEHWLSGGRSFCVLQPAR